MASKLETEWKKLTPNNHFIAAGTAKGLTSNIRTVAKAIDDSLANCDKALASARVAQSQAEGLGVSLSQVKVQAKKLSSSAKAAETIAFSTRFERLAELADALEKAVQEARDLAMDLAREARK